jgi:hypothetical protein
MAMAHVVSKSRWVTDIIHSYAADHWPRDCIELAGRFADFPFRDEASLAQGRRSHDRRAGMERESFRIEPSKSN